MTLNVPELIIRSCRIGRVITSEEILDEFDQQLIEALQIAPRLSWAALGEVLERSPAALASRWGRLEREGLAWIGGHPVGRPGGMTLSFHDVVCDPAQRPAAVQALKEIPDVFSIERCHRGRDMMLTVITPSLMWLTEHVYPQLDQVPGLQRYESSFCTRLHHIAAEWRLGVLDAHQQRRLREGAGQRSPYTGRTPSHFAAILRELARDGRASAAQIAAATGLNPPTVRRQLRQVLGSGAVTIRCETSHRAVGFPVVCEWFCRLPAAEHEDAAAVLRSMSSLRLCTSLTGPANFSFMMWLRSPADIMTVEQRIAARIPGLEVLESVVITEIPKRVGRVLDVDGRSTGQVVLPGPAWG
ncbi:AsnC family transcriptional regulator [Kocuria palustris]|nr:AsnC family transcriptional regulator [Kocuria palustris]